MQLAEMVGVSRNTISSIETGQFNPPAKKVHNSNPIIAVLYSSYKGGTKMHEINTGKFIALILRHKPEVIGIHLDEHGWANVDELIAGIAKTQEFNMAILEEIVRTDNKQRYSFNDDKTKIRANQGHSIPVDVELEQKTPPDVLWHGTGEKYVSSIEAEGLIPKTRLYVHLSSDPGTAIKVGSRHGKPVVYEVAAKEMQNDGYVFFQSVNGVWLTKQVPVKYLKRI